MDDRLIRVPPPRVPNNPAKKRRGRPAREVVTHAAPETASLAEIEQMSGGYFSAADALASAPELATARFTLQKTDLDALGPAISVREFAAAGTWVSADAMDEAIAYWESLELSVISGIPVPVVTVVALARDGGAVRILDGEHRIGLARANRMHTIKTYVWSDLPPEELAEDGLPH